MTQKDLYAATGRIATSGDIPSALELEHLGRAIAFWSFWKGIAVGVILSAPAWAVLANVW